MKRYQVKPHHNQVAGGEIDETLNVTFMIYDCQLEKVAVCFNPLVNGYYPEMERNQQLCHDLCKIMNGGKSTEFEEVDNFI